MQNFLPSPEAIPPPRNPSHLLPNRNLPHHLDPRNNPENLLQQTWLGRVSLRLSRELSVAGPTPMTKMNCMALFCIILSLELTNPPI
jgi:hypothetical protein